MVDFIESKRKKHSWLSPIAISIGRYVRKGCGENRGSGGVSVTRPLQPFSLGETQQDSDATRGRGTGRREAVMLREVARQLATNQRMRGAWQKAAEKMKDRGSLETRGSLAMRGGLATRVGLATGGSKATRQQAGIRVGLVTRVSKAARGGK